MLRDGKMFLIKRVAIDCFAVNILILILLILQKKDWTKFNKVMSHLKTFHACEAKNITVIKRRSFEKGCKNRKLISIKVNGALDLTFDLMIKTRDDEAGVETTTFFEHFNSMGLLGLQDIFSEEDSFSGDGSGDCAIY